MIFTPDPDNIAITIQAAISKLFKESKTGKVLCKDIAINVAKVIQYTLHYFPRKYVKKTADLMKSRATHKIPYGGFKWGMVAMYYEIKAEKEAKYPLTAIIDNMTVKDIIDEVMYDPEEASLLEPEFGDN